MVRLLDSNYQNAKAKRAFISSINGQPQEAFSATGFYCNEDNGIFIRKNIAVAEQYLAHI